MKDKNMSKFIKALVIIILLFIFVGLICPYLISFDSNFLVLTGIAIIIGWVMFLGKLIINYYRKQWEVNDENE